MCACRRGFPATYHDLSMIYDVKAPGRCCQKQHAIPSLDIPHGQKPKTPKKAQNANPQPPRPRTEHPTAHIKRKHPQHVWSLGSSVKYLIFLIFFFYKNHFRLFSIFSSRCRIWNLCALVTVQSAECLYLLQRASPHINQR